VTIEIVLAVLIGVLAVVTLLAAYVGVLGLTGADVLERCPRCRHLWLRLAAADGCGYCRHDRLLHPMWALHHAGTSYWAAHRP
jgi:hypothetical protein